MKQLIYSLFLLCLLVSAKSDKKLYNEKYRPQFHFSPEKNWLFESGGFVHYKGDYHLFYHNVSITNKTYSDQIGHAVSKDLIHWQQLPTAFILEEKAAGLMSSQSTSGSAIVDSLNVSGLQGKDEKPMLIFYSDSIGNQNLAVSQDKGITWNKYANNPIIANPGGNAHDPKVFFHAPTGKWILALFRSRGENGQRGGITFYNSADLLHWKYCSHLEGFGECPDIFELTIEGSSNEKRWVTLSGEGEYKIGQFDGLSFKPETNLQKLDFGKNFYATQTLFNAPKGRVIQIAWMRGGEFPDMAFNGQMSIPTELTLRSTKKGMVLCRKPIEAISSLNDKEIRKKNKNLIPGINGNLLNGIKGDAVTIHAILQLKSADSFGFIVRSGKAANGTDIHYDTAKKILDVNGVKMPLEPIDGKIELEILLDRSSIEIFANQGESGISTCFSPIGSQEEMILYTQGGELFVESLEANTLKSAWTVK
ncbi:MAG: glycoside hydrolase family 32 protein [Prolixibacteraceae bacterium]|jgi:sucrose-6-phosphate hydrolase SacC (GH32 family)|nr:glycoside hydrolase family 32 protein [Prolixibacteraceae bacterium]